MKGTFCAIRPRNESHVAAQAIKLGDDDGGAEKLSLGQRSLELRPAIERIASLPALDLDELADEFDMPLPLLVTFVAGASGTWRIDRLTTVIGDGLPAAERLAVLEALC
jgi:hypothetical protein